MLGVGVQRQALKEAGINHEIVAISEVDKYALKSYELLHGETLNLGDIRNIERIMGWKDVDIDKVEVLVIPIVLFSFQKLQQVGERLLILASLHPKHHLFQLCGVH